MLRRSEKWIRELARAVNVGVDSMLQDDSLRLRLNRLKTSARWSESCAKSLSPP